MSGATAARFLAARTDGRSNQQVVIDRVKDLAPGTVVGYEELAAELSRESDRAFDQRTVQAVVRRANERLLREYCRCLAVVAGAGYVVAHARDHVRLADDRNRKARRQMRRAMNRLLNVRAGEMTPEERALHAAQSTFNATIYQAVELLQRKQDRSDRVIADLTARMERVEESQRPS